MTEPRTAAERVAEVVPGVWHWRIHDDRIDFVSSAHAVASSDGAVLIDPVRLSGSEPLTQFGHTFAICLTAGSHQRSAWRIRREVGASVWAPALARELEEEPDVRYGAGDVLPGGLVAYFTPGAGTTQHTLLLEERCVVFVPDLLLRSEGSELAINPWEHSYDPAEQRRSLEKILELPFSVLCLAHGAPVTEEPKAAIHEALARAGPTRFD